MDDDNNDWPKAMIPPPIQTDDDGRGAATTAMKVNVHLNIQF